MQRGHLLAVTASALIGIVSGIVGGFVVDHPGRADSDPLGLGVPLVNQPCQPNGALLLLASSDNESGLGPEIAAHPGARYLETAHSCDTAWRPQGSPSETYVVYLGPMERTEACSELMTAEHRGDQVTMLNSGNTDTVPCVCYVSYQQAPVLRPNAELSDLDVIYVHSLQELLTAMGRRSDLPLRDVYDQAMAAKVSAFQQFSGRPANGIVDEGTWKALTSRGCENL